MIRNIRVISLYAVLALVGVLILVAPQGAGAQAHPCYAPDAFSCQIYMNPITIGGGAAPTLSFLGSPTTIRAGEAATLTWSATNAFTCSSEDFAVTPASTQPAEGLNFTLGATSGSVAVSPAGTKTYSLSCFSISFDPLNSSVTKSVTIVVEGTGGGDTPPVITAPGDFLNVFHIDNDADHSAIYDTVVRPLAHLSSGASAPIGATYDFPYAGTWYVRSCADNNGAWQGAIDESNEDNNCTDWLALAIGTNAIDLTASGVSTASVIRNEPAQVTASVANRGNASTVIGFPSAFQFFFGAAEPSENDPTTMVQDSSPALAPLQGDAISTMFSFPTSGTWKVRACADTTTSWVSTIVEADERNNCGPWTSVTVSDWTDQCRDGIDNDGDGHIDAADGGCTSGDGTESLGATASLSATPIAIRSGGTSLLSWSSANADSCTGQGFETSGATSSAVGVPVSPDTTTSYGITCGSASDTVTVSVSSPTAFISTDRIIVDPRKGGEFNLLWSATGVGSCAIVSSDAQPAFQASYAPVEAGTTTTAVAGLRRQTRFTLECAALVGGSVSATVQVNVPPDYTEF